MIQYISTRGGGVSQTFEQVLLQGLAPDGGLYVPETWPRIDPESLRGKSYLEIAEAVMTPFVEGCLSPEELHSILVATYNTENFHDAEITPLKKLNDRLHVLELFHGPTLAFKDVALQFLGRVFDAVLQKRDEQITIVGATSGDTGSAAIEGCRHSENAQIFILHPHGRVSDVQRRQMTTVNAPNVHNIAIEGTFDDCQNLVKAMFNDKKFRTDLNLSAVNSINWARILAQIVYYYAASVQFDEPVSFVVPTGNFGNVYAAYCAQKMGLKMKTLALATNRNDILTRFFESGKMKTETVQPTMSPSMDIQISSNFERYLFDLMDRDAESVQNFMQQFSQTGQVAVSENVLGRAKKTFRAFRCSEEGTQQTIRRAHEEYGYILDPHSAVGMYAAQQLLQETDGPVVSLACAHPAKFPDTVEKAMGQWPALPEDLSDLMEREEHVSILPNDLATVQNFIRATR